MGRRLLCLLAVWGSAWAQVPAKFTAAEERGRQIYLTGESATGAAIQAEISGGAVAGSMMPCGTCHGRDGKGTSEGGVTPSSIRWNDLARPYEVTSASGRKHAAYDERLFARALTVGLDPAGNRLDQAMPRFRIGTQDANDLVAWLKRIGENTAEGISGDGIVVGALLPLDAGSNGEAMRAALAAYFEQVNRAGGIYGRRIDFRAVGLTGDRARRLEEARAFVESARPFTLVASYVSGFEREFAATLRQRELPLVGAFTPWPVQEDPPNPEVFYLDGGLRGQAEALARFAVARFADGPKRMAIAAGTEEIYRQAALAAEGVIKGAGWAVDSASKLALVLRPVEGSGLLNDAGVRFLLPGVLAGEGTMESAAAREERLFLAYPTLPSDYEAGASDEYAALAERAGLPRKFVSAQLMALASARLLVEGLEHGGRDLSRGKLVDALENLFEFHTGFTAPLTFGPNRRIGYTGARIVVRDAETGGLKPIAVQP